MTEPEVVDAHVHVGLAKYGPVERYVKEMDRLGLRRAVLVQYVGNDDDRYLGECLRRYPGRFAAIGAVDPNSPASVDSLEQKIEATGICGVRLPANARTSGSDPLAIWRRADDLALIVSIRGPLGDIASWEFRRIVQTFSRIRFRLEHLASLKSTDDGPLDAQYRRVLELAALPNTFMMWSGFYLNSAGPYPYASSAEAVALAYRAFGAERTMWSGDWNRPEITTGAYRAEMRLIGEDFAVDTAADAARILGGTAAALFPFDRQPT